LLIKNAFALAIYEGRQQMSLFNVSAGVGIRFKVNIQHLINVLALVVSASKRVEHLVNNEAAVVNPVENYSLSICVLIYLIGDWVEQHEIIGQVSHAVRPFLISLTSKENDSVVIH